MIRLKHQHQFKKLIIMKKNLFAILFLMLSAWNYAQGCSDAGICTIGSSFHDTEKEVKNNLEIGTIFGAGEADLTYFSPYITYTRIFSKRFAMSAKVTYSSADGSLGTISQFGDGYLIGNYQWKSAKTSKWSTLFGVKFPFTNSNQKIKGNPLPLDYQSSLGTIDLIAGTNLNYKKWDFNVGFQVPIINNNRNSYFKEFSVSDEFPSTNLFERKPDVLLRATYTYKTNKKFIFKPNVLFLYHLGEDSYENTLGKRANIDGSDGLTINGNLISAYQINKTNSIELSMATPFVVRTIRPDGLTRSFTAGLIYKVAF